LNTWAIYIFMDVPSVHSAGWPAWVAWGLGLGADSASAYRGNDITQLGSSVAGFPKLGTPGRVIGTGLATYNFISNTK
jgi:hypothetical protein